MPAAGSALAAISAMIQEVLDWRVVFEARPLPFPG